MSHDFRRDGSRTVWRWRRLPLYAHITESASYHIHHSAHYGVDAHQWAGPCPGRAVAVSLGRWEFVVGKYR